MAPIFLLAISRTLILQSVVRVVPFRKRPSETHSGPGLETPTDAVTVVRLQHQVRSRPYRRASRRGLFFCYKYLSVALHKGSCVKSLSSRFPVSCLLTSFFRCSETKPQQTTRAAKDYQPHTQPHRTRPAWSCFCSKGRRISLRVKQTKYAAVATCTRYVADPGPADAYALKRAEQTAGCVSSNGFTYLQDMQEVINEPLQLH